MKSPFNQFNDRWRFNHLQDTELYVYSAYYDDRKRSLSAKEGNYPVVRINVLAPKEFKVKNKNTVCVVKLKDGTIFTLRIHVIQLLEHFNMKWCSYFVNCKLTETITRKLPTKNQTMSAFNKIEKDNISSVSLINQDLKYYNIIGNYNFSNPLPGELEVYKSQVPNHKDSNIEKNLVSDLNTLAICVKPVYLNWNRAIWLVEFFEMYRLLGKNQHVFQELFNHFFFFSINIFISL